MKHHATRAHPVRDALVRLAKWPPAKCLGSLATSGGGRCDRGRAHHRIAPLTGAGGTADPRLTFQASFVPDAYSATKANGFGALPPTDATITPAMKSAPDRESLHATLMKGQGVDIAGSTLRVCFQNGPQPFRTAPAPKGQPE